MEDNFGEREEDWDVYLDVCIFQTSFSLNPHTCYTY